MANINDRLLNAMRKASDRPQLQPKQNIGNRLANAMQSASAVDAIREKEAARPLPSVGERIGLNLKGTGERRLSGHLGTAENLARAAQPGLKKFNDLASGNLQKQKHEQENAAHYRDILAKGYKPDGTRLTSTDRTVFAQLAQRAERNAKSAQAMMDADAVGGLGVIKDLDRYGNQMAEKAQADTARGREGLGKVWGTVYDVGSAGADLLADAAENAIIPGAGTASRVSRMYGQGAEKAQAADANVLQQALAGGATAGIGEGVNRLFSSNPLLKKAYGKGALDDILFPNLGKSVPGAMLKSAFGEGLEEGAEDVLDEAAENIIYDHENKDKLTAKEVGYDALVGAILGGLTGASNVKRFRPQETSTEPTQTAQDSVSSSAPTTDTPKANVRPTAVNEDSSVVAENATTTPTVQENRTVSNEERVAQAQARVDAAKERGASREEQRIYETDLQNAKAEKAPRKAPETPKSGLSWKQNFYDHSIFTTIASKRASSKMIGDAVGSFAENAGKLYQPGDVNGVFGEYRWHVDHHKWGPYFELTLRNDITGEVTRISGDKTKVGVAGEIESAIYNDGIKTVNAVINDADTSDVDASSDVENVENPQMNPSMGAADAGFDGGYAGFQGRATDFHPINEDAAERTMEEQGRAPSEVPKTNPDTGKYIGKNASTIINSPLTSNEMSGVFEEAVANGKADKVPIPDAKRAADAVKAVEDAGGYKAVARSFVDMVDGNKRITPQDIVNAIHAYNLANQEGDNATAFMLGEALYSMSGEVASGLRAYSFFNRLTPTGHLLSLRRTLERINKNAHKGRKKRLTESVEALFNQAIEQANTQRDDAINTMIEAMQAYAEILGVGKDGKAPDLADVMKRVAKGKGSASDIDSKINETQRSWIEELARELSKNVERKANQGKSRENTIFELISSDLNKFLDSYFPKEKGKGKRRTAADRIADYLNNKEQYQAAWAKAQDALQQKYADDPDMLAKLDEWSYSTLGYTGSGSDAVLLKAIADAALESDVSLKETLIRGEYDPQNLGAEIAADIIKRLGLYGKPDAATIVDAANRYVERRSADLAYKRGKGADSYFEGDIRKDMSAIGTKMADIIRQGADSKEALAKRIADMMVGQYHVSPEGAQRIANDITAKFNSMVNDAAKRQLESMFKDRPKPEQKTMQKHFEELANMGAFTDPRFNTKATSKVFGTEGVTIDEKKAQAYLDAKTDEERHDAWEALLDDAASKVSSTLMDKFTALRYINMLGTLKGPERNVLGNVGMMMMSSVNNQVNTFLERATKSGKTRSHTVDRARMKAAADYFQTIKGYAMGEQKYADSSSTKGEVAREVMDRRRIYKWGLMEGARKGTNWILNNKYFGDEAFSRHAFSRALAGYMKANGVTAEQFANPEWRAQHADFVSKATDFSAKQAQENTFRDSNTFSSWISKIGRRPDTPWYGRMASEGLSPFRKTPANVLVRAEEYSPLGLINAAVKQAQRMAGNSEITGADVVQSLSKSLTGTGLFVLGMALKNSGLLRGADDEDDEQAAFDDLQGHQEYSLELPDGTSVTLSWLSPIAMPLFMGAQFWTLAQEDGFEAKDLENALTSLADPMLEMSMLSGVEDTIGKFKYADGSNLGQIAVSTMLGYLTQGLTNTLAGQISRLGEDESMMTYVDRNSPVPPWLQKELGKISRKTPGWDYQQVPYIDAWGRSEKTGDYLTRAMNNLANPAFTSKVDSTFVDEELQKLADRTGETSIFPNRAEYSFDVNGKKWNMNAQQWERYAREKGTTAHKTLDSLMRSPEWRSLSDDDKLDAIEKAYTYSSAKAKSSVNHSYKPGDTAKAALESALPLDKYILYQKTADADGNDRTSSTECAKALLNLSGISNETRGAVWSQKNKQTAPEKNPFTGTLHRYGVSPEKAVDIHAYYSQINKMDAKDKDKARWFADYISRQGLTSTQIAAAKQTYRFWGSYPIRYK